MNIIQKSEVNHNQKHSLRFASKLMSTIAVGALGAMAFSAVHAQSTSARIIGKAPSDGTVTVHSDAGVIRHGSANSQGRYTISSLPPGIYVVSLEKSGNTVASLGGVQLLAAKAFEVDFACDNDQCTAAPGH
jgi:hypothetical protein